MFELAFFWFAVVMGVMLLFFAVERLTKRPMDAIEQRREEQRRERR